MKQFCKNIIFFQVYLRLESCCKSNFPILNKHQALSKKQKILLKHEFYYFLYEFTSDFGLVVHDIYTRTIRSMTPEINQSKNVGCWWYHVL